MDRDLRKFILIILVFLVFGGAGAVWKLFAGSFEVLKAIWKIRKWEIIKGIVVSPKTLTMVIVGLLSAFGFFVSYKTKKKICAVVSGILAMIDFLLMFS